MFARALSTVLLDPPTTLMAGAILALVSARLIARQGLAEVRRGLRWAVAWSLLYGLTVGWPFFFRADWMFVYLIDSTTVPLLPAYLLFLFLLAGFGAMGFLSVAVLFHLGKRALAWAAAICSATSLAACLAITVSRYSSVGTTAEYLAGAAKPISADEGLTTAMTAAPLVFGAAAVAIIVQQVRRTMRSVPRSSVTRQT